MRAPGTTHSGDSQTIEPQLSVNTTFGWPDSSSLGHQGLVRTFTSPRRCADKCLSDDDLAENASGNGELVERHPFVRPVGVRNIAGSPDHTLEPQLCEATCVGSETDTEFVALRHRRAELAVERAVRWSRERRCVVDHAHFDSIVRHDRFNSGSYTRDCGVARHAREESHADVEFAALRNHVDRDASSDARCC